MLEAAALRSAVARAIVEDDERARLIQESLGQLIAVQDYRTYHRDSRQFHLVLLALSGMQRLLHMFELASNVTEPAQPMAAVSDDERPRMHADHDAMPAAFVARDAEELVRCSTEHHHRLERAVELQEAQEA